MLSLNNCNLCPRKCGVDREYQSGFCGVSGKGIKAARASLHMWEEPCISGTNGSGTIFFSGCNLRCVYCQNHLLSRECKGRDISVFELADVMLRLQKQGAHNINLVTPTHYSVQLIESIKLAREKGLYIPIVYNTSGYESVEAISQLCGTVSIYLTDYKYADNALALKYSGANNYDDVAFSALEEMVRQVGSPHFDKDGLMLSGVIVRHLVLPGQTENSKYVLKKLYHTFGDQIIISIMNQYTPMGVLPYAELNRTVSEKEYDDVTKFALEIGIENAYIQEGKTQSESFIPDFNGEGL